MKLLAQRPILSDSTLNKSTVVKIRFQEAPICDSVETWAKADIAHKTPFLFLQSGIAPIIYSNDKVFEYKYGVYFDDFGDVGMSDYTCIIKYNSIVFEYLTKTYSNKWIKEIRKDIIGFKQWKKNRRK